MKPADILEDGSSTYRSKQDDYGDSWRLVGQFLFMLTQGEGVELESEEDFIAFGLYTRRLDKLARAFNGEFLADEMNHESIVDSHEDEMVYASMHASNQYAREPSGTSGSLVDTIRSAGNALVEGFKDAVGL